MGGSTMEKTGPSLATTGSSNVFATGSSLGATYSTTESFLPMNYRRLMISIQEHGVTTIMKRI